MKVGLILPMTENEQGIERYHYLREMARYAEAVGFDSVWVCDHILFRDEGGGPARGTWEAATLAAGICAATSRAEIGTLVMCTAFRNPVLLAKTAVTLDEISDGRLVLGLGAGWHRPELSACGLPTTNLVSRFEEAVEIISSLLRNGHVDFTGHYYLAPDCELTPRGPRPGRIPILIGGEGRRVMRLAARFGDAWNTAWYNTVANLDERLNGFAAECSQAGRDLSAIDTTVGFGVRNISLPNTESRDAVWGMLYEFRQRGIRHVICDVQPFTHDSVAWLAEIVIKAKDVLEERA